MKTLDEVRNFLSNINDINRGGCGIAALAMIRWIRKNLHREVDNIYFEHTRNHDFNNNSNYLKKGVDMIAAPTHIYISFKKKIFDVDYPIKCKIIERPIYFKSEDILVETINNVLS